MAMIGKHRRKRFGEILIAEKLVTHEQIAEALKLQRDSGGALGGILLDLGHINEGDIVKALSIQYQIPYIATANYDIDRKLVESFDAYFLHRHALLPFDRISTLMLLLSPDIPTKAVMTEFQRLSKCDIAVYLGTRTDVRNVLMEMAPLSAENQEKLKREIERSRLDPQEKEAVKSKETGTMELGDLQLSSEKILSSLDEAWDSIFVESEGKKK